MERVSPADRRDLGGRVAVVTGASRGIGRAIALALAGEGMTVVAAGRDATALQELAAPPVAAPPVASSRPGAIVAAPCDLTLEADVKALFARVEETAASAGRPLELLVNSAGAFLARPFLETSYDDWHRILDANLSSIFLTAREAAQLMLASGGGMIVNLSSVGGRIGLSGKSAYCASKFGVVGLSRALARELQPRRIKVHVLYPYVVDSAGQADWARDPERADILAVEDVARTVVFLASLPDRFMIPDLDLNPLFLP